MANQKRYAQRGQELAGVFARMADEILTWRDVYWDRGYNAGGADPLLDADVADLDITAADLAGMVTLADALETFLTANRGYLSKVRSDL